MMPLDPDCLRSGDVLAHHDRRGTVVFEAESWGEGTVSGEVIKSRHPGHAEGAFITCPLDKAEFADGCRMYGDRHVGRVRDGFGRSVLVCDLC